MLEELLDATLEEDALDETLDATLEVDWFESDALEFELLADDSSTEELD